MTRKSYRTVFFVLALAGCESEPKVALSPVTMNCDQDSCVVSFEVTNTSEGALPLVYDISLNRNYIQDPNRSGLVVVGTINGLIDLPPSETRSIKVDIDVTDMPNGSKVSVFDSRTPKLILEILDS